MTPERKAVVRVLKTRFPNDATRYEKLIYGMCQRLAEKSEDGASINDIYRTESYQRVGHFFAASDTEVHHRIIDDLKNDVGDWETSPFEKYRRELEAMMNKIVEKPKVQKGAFKCRRCTKDLCYFWTLQTRSSDEGATVFIQCVNCGNRWREY